MKTCIKCNKTKELFEFHKDKSRKSGFKESCKSCMAQYRQTRKEWYAAYMKEYRKENKEKIAKQIKQYQQTNKEKIRKQQREYFRKTYEVRKDRVNKQRRRYISKKRSSDPLYRLTENVRCLVRNGLRQGGFLKGSKTADILGCSYEKLQQHLIQTFEMNYCIEYSSEYNLEIDHIYPVSLAQTEEELISLNHYSNLQYLFAEDNYKKSNDTNFKL